ncbi:DUF4288 domain-containing protein [Granulicella sp. S190]|uniref:DUF4288 domain-containing protein n=1 Tax=Granulicella sp. S190 TaxID=1747226 RepID=UPI00131A9E9C|nr:DUF4288 domain-containing protein [Granulicella sp. S190]
MKWYTAKCLYRTHFHDSTQCSGILGEYRYYLVMGDDEDAAREKSVNIARNNAHGYLNAEGGTTAWIFEEVVELHEILAPELSEGVEIFSEYIP